MSIKKVMIAGSGTLGSQIAWQVAFSGFDVTVYDLFEEGLERAKEAHHRQYAEHFSSVRGATEAEITHTMARLSYTTDLASAVEDADLTSESIPEDLNIKREFYQKLGELAPEKTIFTTNTSTLLPSEFAQETGRPEKFLALHFGNPVWDANIGEVMKQPATDDAVFEQVLGFASSIGMVPMRLEKEQSGYIINSLLVPWFVAAQTSVTNGIADFTDVDKTWMICTKMDKGPFGVMDLIGLETIYLAMKHGAAVNNDLQQQKNADYIKKHFVDANKLGAKSGAGFYEYPNPAYTNDDFLSP